MIKLFAAQNLREKLLVSITLLFAIIMIAAVAFSAYNERNYIQQLAEEQVDDLTTWYFDSLNTMMLTGTMEQRTILQKKVLARTNIIDARVIRGDPVKQQFGPGFETEQARDDYDLRALKGEKFILVEERDGHRVVTAITPFKATHNTRGVDCLGCHKVPEGSVNGAIRISYSLDKLDKTAFEELTVNVGLHVVLFLIGMWLINRSIERWLTVPLSDMMNVVRARAMGDTSARFKVTSRDEIGQLGRAFNEMADNVNELHQRENQNAIILQRKIEDLLTVVNYVAEGDFTRRVGFGGDDNIGELATSLQVMVDYIRLSIDEKKNAVQVLTAKVNQILDVVTSVAAGDLTGRVKLPGGDVLSDLADGIHEMTESLNELVLQIKQSNQSVVSSADLMQRFMGDVEHNAMRQAEYTGHVSGNIDNITKISHSLSSTMDEVSSATGKASDSARQSHENLQQMEAFISNLDLALRLVMEKLEIMNSNVSNISSVITTITKVADRTNLLSLNAAIEAEKAGDAGKGFNLIANEIRRLSDQTALATMDISHLIKELNLSAQHGVESVLEFRTQLQNGIKEVQMLGREQVKIVKEVENLHPQFEQVASSMREQSSLTDQIQRAMAGIDKSATQTLASINAASDALQGLVGASRVLERSVSRFQVKRSDD